MNSRLSIPTDNIYKFYAIFGLAFCIGALTLFVFTYNTHLESSVSLTLELTKLESNNSEDNLIQAKKEMLQNLLKIGNSNKDLYMSIISLSFSLGLFVMAIGFYRWHYKIQPQLDRLVVLQIKQLEQALSKGEICTPFSRRGKINEKR